MRVTESIFSKSMKIKTDDPYALSLDIMKRVSNFAKVIERRNNYMTDGPHHVSEVIFYAIQDLDEHTRVRFSFELFGKENELRINVEGVVIVNIIKYGLVSEMFSDYYIKSIYPEVKKDMKSRRDSLIKQINKILSVL